MGATVYLGKGVEVIVDNAKVEDVRSKTWTIVFDHQGAIKQIASRVRESGRSKRVNLSRYLLGILDPDLWVVRVPGTDLLDFRVCCFKIVPCNERQMVSGKRKSPTTSQYKGVSYNHKNQKWRASIRPRGASYFLGEYEHEEDAARAYDQAATVYFGPNAYRNFK